jgi:HAE1 family hydrophobic/amphiphilic exporter-1
VHGDGGNPLRSRRPRTFAGQLLPEISYPTLTIQTDYPDAAPAEVEVLVTEPLEEAVSVVQGLRRLHSISQSGMSQIVLEFAWGTKMDYAGLDVREKIDLVDLPDDVRPPVLLRFDPALDPVLRIAAYGDSNLVALRHWSERTLKKDLEALDGVASARVQGGLVEEFHVELDEGKMALLGVSNAEVSTALAQNNLNASGGRLRDRESEFLVRALNELADVDDVTRVVILDRDGRTVRLGDIATVKRGHQEREIISRVQGRECVEIALYKEGDANTVNVARRVRQRLENLKKTLPPGLETRILLDQAVFIENAIDEVRSNAIQGGLLAVLVLFLFLKELRSTFIIGLSIPVSIIATFVLMQQMGVTLNIMSLGGLALGVGMLVDNSIVVLEAVSRHRRPGESPVVSSERGTMEVGRAVMASTLTTIAVFLPIIFVEGVAGQIFRDQALTVTFSLIISLLVALTLIPMAAALQRRDWMRLVSADLDLDAATAAEPVIVATAPAAPRRPAGRFARGLGRTFRIIAWPFRKLAWLVWMIAWPIRAALGDLVWPWIGRPVTRALLIVGRVVPVFLLRIARRGTNIAHAGFMAFSRRVLFPPFDAVWNRFEATYARLLDRALQRRGVVLGGTLALFIASLAMVPILGIELIPDFTQGEFVFDVELPEGTPLSVTDTQLTGIEAQVARDPRVEMLALDVGGTDRLGGDPSSKPNRAHLSVVLRDRSDTASEAAVIEEIRQALGQIDGLTYEFRRPSYFSFRTPIEVELYGHDLAELERSTQDIVKHLQSVPGLRDVRASLEPGNPEVQIAFNRERVAAMNLDIDTISRTLRDKIRGDSATKLRERDRQVDILVRTARADQVDIGQVGNLVVAQADGVPIMLSSVADIAVERGPSQIEHVDQQRAALVSADLSGRDLGEIGRDLRAHLDTATLPSGVTAVLAGQSDELQTSLRSLMFAMLLATFMVYIVMASQFESLLHPFVILCTVPLGLIGVVVALFATGTAISIVVLLGVIMLAGIVVNNAIVMVDYVNQRRADGVAKLDALREAATVRLRPISPTDHDPRSGADAMAWRGAIRPGRSPSSWLTVSALCDRDPGVHDRGPASVGSSA